MIKFFLGIIDYYTFWFIIISIVLAFILFYSFIHLFKFFNILITPTTTLNKLKEGKIEIKGIAQREDTEFEAEEEEYNDFNSYVKNYIAYSSENLKTDEVLHKEIEEEYVSGKNGGWKERGSIINAIPFYVYDKTKNKILIKPSGATFEFKNELIEDIDVKHRIKHYSIKNNDQVYVLGYCHKTDKEPYISNHNNEMFFISTKKESTLLLQHGFKGFLYLFIAIAIISLSLFFANKKYKETWEGRVVSKTSYVSGSGKNRTTHYIVLLKNDSSSREITYSRWKDIKNNDYIVKYENEFYIKIVEKGKHQ